MYFCQAHINVHELNLPVIWKRKSFLFCTFCCWKVTEWTCPHTVCTVKLYNKVSGTMHITCSTSKDWYLSFFATCWWGLNENTDNYTRFSNCGFLTILPVLVLVLYRYTAALPDTNPSNNCIHSAQYFLFLWSIHPSMMSFAVLVLCNEMYH